jgi:hypothetical protein
MIFSELEMFDDGNHNDGLASDGLYGTKISNCSNAIDYYIYLIMIQQVFFHQIELHMSIIVSIIKF